MVPRAWGAILTLEEGPLAGGTVHKVPLESLRWADVFVGSAQKDEGPLSKGVVFCSSIEDAEEGWVQVTVGPQVGQKEG